MLFPPARFARRVVSLKEIAFVGNQKRKFPRRAFGEFNYFPADQKWFSPEMDVQKTIWASPGKKTISVQLGKNYFQLRKNHLGLLG